MDEILKLGARELTQKIRAGELTPLVVAETCIQHLRKENPRLNALVEDRFDQALDQARQWTEDLKENLQAHPEKKLLGVCFTVKEMLAVEGFKRTAGSHFYQEERMNFTSTVVQRLLNEGALLLGTSNVPELGFWFETDNLIYGTTNNPYDVSRTAGGSSGGEGALVSSGASFFGIGSDVGGSVRIPGFFCGVFAHKPTHRSLPLTGHFPYSQKDISELNENSYPYTSLGPLCKKAEDLVLLLEIIAGPDEWDPLTQNSPPVWKRSLNFQKLKVFSLPDPILHLTRRTDLELQNSVIKVTESLRKNGADVIALDSKFFLRAVELWGGALSHNREKFFEKKLTRSEGLRLPKEIVASLTGRGSRHTWPALVTVALERLLGQSKRDTSVLVHELRELRDRLEKILGEEGVLVMPPHSRVAPKHRHVYLTPFDFVYSGIFNALELPATTVPLGLNELGLPLGVQLVSSRNCDGLNLAVAQFLEKEFGGWQPLPP